MNARILLAALATAMPFSVHAQSGSAAAHGPNWIAIGMFLLIVAVTLIITFRSARRTKSKADFYTAATR